MRLGIFSRLFLGYFLLLVLAAGMSVYAVIQLSLVADVTRSIILVDNALINLHKDMTDDLLSETRYEKKYLIVQDQALYEGFLKSRKDFEQHLEKARKLGADDEVRSVLDRVADRHEAYNTLFMEEAEKLREGLSFPSLWYAEEKDKAVNDAIDELMKLRVIGQERIYDKVKDLGEAGTRARTIAMAVSAACLLFGLLLAVWITRSITRPLSLMQKKTKDIADGVFEADLQVSSSPEIGALAQAINSMCSKLKEVDKMKMDFFALMSHELRTPLTAIKEGTNLFLEGHGGDVTDKQKKLLTIISEESNRLIGLVNSVLDLSKLEAGMLAFNFSKGDLAPLVARVIDEVGPLAEAKLITIEGRTQDTGGVSIDAERILQVLRNLVGNALKFTPRGGTVRITAGRREGGVVVAVSDTGPGIPKEHLSGIFDKFRQVPGAGRLPGTGLGLAIVKHIIQAHGGTIWVESEVRHGSAFLFRLPC